MYGLCCYLLLLLGNYVICCLWQKCAQWRRSVLDMWSANGKHTSNCITLHIKIHAILIILTHDYFHKVTHTHTTKYTECIRILLLVRAVGHDDMFRPLYVVILRQLTKGEHKTQHTVLLNKNSPFVPRVFNTTLELDTQIQTHNFKRHKELYARHCMFVCLYVGTVQFSLEQAMKAQRGSKV